MSWSHKNPKRRITLRHTIRRGAVIVSLTLFVSLGWISTSQANGSVNSGVVVREWNQLALDTVRVKLASDAQAARLYAMVNVASTMRSTVSLRDMVRRTVITP
jgi:hypothetical protein